jgi:hypothetical protein
VLFPLVFTLLAAGVCHRATGQTVGFFFALFCLVSIFAPPLIASEARCQSTAWAKRLAPAARSDQVRDHNGGAADGWVESQIGFVKTRLSPWQRLNGEVKVGQIVVTATVVVGLAAAWLTEVLGGSVSIRQWFTGVCLVATYALPSHP